MNTRESLATRSQHWAAKANEKNAINRSRALLRDHVMTQDRRERSVTLHEVIDDLANGLVEAVGIEISEDRRERLREGLDEIVLTYLLERRAAPIPITPWKEARKLQHAAAALQDADQADHVLDQFPDSWRALLGEYGPGPGERIRDDSRRFEIADNLVEQAKENPVSRAKLQRWIRRTARLLGRAKPGRKVQWARYYAVRQLGRLFSDVYGRRAGFSFGGDEFRDTPFLRFVRTFLAEFNDRPTDAAIRRARGPAKGT